VLLHREIVEMIRLPDMKERIAALGFGVVGNTPAEFGKQIAFEIEKWAKVIRAANVKAE
jgi:tripartite-type tricarboxylate transporter receptor subunit TctC